MEEEQEKRQKRFCNKFNEGSMFGLQTEVKHGLPCAAVEVVSVCEQDAKGEEEGKAPKG